MAKLTKTSARGGTVAQPLGTTRQEGRVQEEAPAHLLNAARTLQRILNNRDPEHVYTVDVRPDAHRVKDRLARIADNGEKS